MKTQNALSYFAILCFTALIVSCGDSGKQSSENKNTGQSDSSNSAEKGDGTKADSIAARLAPPPCVVVPYDPNNIGVIDISSRGTCSSYPSQMAYCKTNAQVGIDAVTCHKLDICEYTSIVVPNTGLSGSGYSAVYSCTTINDMIKDLDCTLGHHLKLQGYDTDNGGYVTLDPIRLRTVSPSGNGFEYHLLKTLFNQIFTAAKPMKDYDFIIERANKRLKSSDTSAQAKATFGFKIMKRASPYTVEYYGELTDILPGAGGGSTFFVKELKKQLN